MVWIHTEFGMYFTPKWWGVYITPYFGVTIVTSDLHLICYELHTFWFTVYIILKPYTSPRTCSNVTCDMFIRWCFRPLVYVPAILFLRTIHALPVSPPLSHEYSETSLQRPHLWENRFTLVETLAAFIFLLWLISLFYSCWLLLRVGLSLYREVRLY